MAEYSHCDWLNWTHLEQVGSFPACANLQLMTDWRVTLDNLHHEDLSAILDQITLTEVLLLADKQTCEMIWRQISVRDD